MDSYRIKYKLFRGWEPQHRYKIGASDGYKWFPLNGSGYWLEPDAYSYGVITKHNYFKRPEAIRITLLARAINQEHVRAA